VTSTATGTKGAVVEIYPSEDGKAAFVRLERGADMLQGLNEAAAKLGIEAGTIQAIGAVSELTIGYFDQDRKEYRTNAFPSAFEIGSGLGNVSLKDEKPFVHLHVLATGPDGATVGGHLMEGTKVYLIEAYLRQLGGEPPVREQDDDLGLAVWH
jgi:predicted DNA-binding protein with PD1-like motif